MKPVWNILHPVLLAAFLAFPSATQAQDSRRPITFSTCVGALSASSFYKVSDGWHPLFGFEVHTDLRSWLAYHLDLTFTSAQNLSGSDVTPRFFTASVSFGIPIRSAKFVEMSEIK